MLTSLLLDGVPWDRGAGSARVAAGYIQTVGLRPEDCFGMVPTHRGAGELLFLYRDSPEYAERRGRPLPATGRSSRWFPGIEFQGSDVPRSDRDQAEVMEMLGSQLAAAGLGGLPIEALNTPAPSLSGDPAAPIFCHHLQWPGVSRIEGFGSPSEYFAFYSRVVGLRPEDCFGWVPDQWNPHGSDSNHWEEFHLVYRDRPEYREGRSRLAALGGRHEVGDSEGFGGSATSAPPLAGPPVGATAAEAKWPRRRLMRLRGDDLREHLSALAATVSPEHCFGIGVDRWSDHLWSVTAS